MLRIAFAVLLFAAQAIAQEAPLPAGAVARVGSARLRHGDAICALTYSPDGKLLASADVAGEIRVHDAAGKVLQQFSLDMPSAIRNEAFLAPGAAVVDDEGLGQAPVRLCFSSDGRRLFVGSGKSVRAYRLDNGRLEFNHALLGDETCLAISPGLTLAVAGMSSSLRELDASGGALRP